MASILGARDAVPRLLDLFAEYCVAATWATVGFLFAESRDELESFHPALRPRYHDRRLDPYSEAIGRGESDDPLHFAPGLVRLINSAPRQELGTHTYSHFYCLEAGAEAEAFRQDIASALEIGRAKGVDVRSIVLPRNQWNAGYASILREAGIECYRGTQPGWMYGAIRESEQTPPRRIARLVDAHLPWTEWNGVGWDEVYDASGLHNIRASCFLRPVGNGSRGLNDLRRRRIAAGMQQAARDGRIFHVWWHPHNFGTCTSENLAFLRCVLEQYRVLASECGMRSMSMIEASRHAGRISAAKGTSRDA